MRGVFLMSEAPLTAPPMLLMCFLPHWPHVLFSFDIPLENPLTIALVKHFSSKLVKHLSSKTKMLYKITEFVPMTNC